MSRCANEGSSTVQNETEYHKRASLGARVRCQRHGWTYPRWITYRSFRSEQCDPSLLGLVSIEIGPPLESTAARAKGFDFGLIAVLEKPDDVKVYAEHPVHQKWVDAFIFEATHADKDENRVHKLRESLCDDTLAYDMVVWSGNVLREPTLYLPQIRLEADGI
jgi:hypothetical protein